MGAVVVYHDKRRCHEFKNLALDRRAVEAALWWHDLIYDTRATDNEHTSAEIAKTDMGLLHCTSDFQERVVAAILATKHDSAVIDHDQQLVLDIDLHSLGVSSIRYKQYVTGIRREYEGFLGRHMHASERRFLKPSSTANISTISCL